MTRTCHTLRDRQTAYGQTHRFQGFKIFYFSTHLVYKQTKLPSNELKSKVAEWNHLETQANSTTRYIETKRFPITPDGVLGVAPYLLFTSVLVGTIHKYKK